MLAILAACKSHSATLPDTDQILNPKPATVCLELGMQVSGRLEAPMAEFVVWLRRKATALMAEGGAREKSATASMTLVIKAWPIATIISCWCALPCQLCTLKSSAWTRLTYKRPWHRCLMMDSSIINRDPLSNQRAVSEKAWHVASLVKSEDMQAWTCRCGLPCLG